MAMRPSRTLVREEERDDPTSKRGVQPPIDSQPRHQEPVLGISRDDDSALPIARDRMRARRCTVKADPDQAARAERRVDRAIGTECADGED